MSSIPHPLTPSFVTAAAAALLALSATTSQAAPVTVTYDFDLTVDGVFLAGSGAAVSGSPLVGQPGTASLSFDIDTAGLTQGDTLNLDNDNVSAFEATILGQDFGKDDAADVTDSPFQPTLPSGNTPIASLVAGANIGTNPFDLDLSFFGVGFTEVTSLTTLAGDFTFAGDRLTAIDEEFVVAIVALFDAGGDTGSFVAPSYTDDDGNEVTGSTGQASVSVGVVPVPPAIAFSLTGLAGLAAIRRRRARA